jgi:transcriptional regulator with XRE-family HTH domain
VHKNTLSFGQRLKTARLLLVLSQQQAADICGVRREMWGKYERDEAEPGIHVLERFSAHGADAEYLLIGTTRSKNGNEVDAIEVLSAIAIHLQTPVKGTELEDIYQLLQAEKDSWSAGSAEPGINHFSWDAIRLWLNRSPVVISDPVEFEDVIEKLEFALDMSGKTLSYVEKARAILSLFRQSKELALGQRLGLDKFKEVIDRNGYPKPI